MSNLLPDKVLVIFLHNPVYKRNGFRMWGHILKKYDPRGKDSMFKSVSDLYTLEQIHDKPISACMSRARRLFSGIHVITFNTMANIFFIVNSDRSLFGALVYCFRDGDPKVVNAEMDCLKTLFEVIKSRSQVANPSAFRSSTPTPVPPPKSDRPKTTAPSAGTRPSYPNMRPKWDEVTKLAKANKVCYTFLHTHMWAQGCFSLDHAGLIISNDP